MTSPRQHLTSSCSIARPAFPGRTRRVFQISKLWRMAFLSRCRLLPSSSSHDRVVVLHVTHRRDLFQNRTSRGRSSALKDPGSACRVFRLGSVCPPVCPLSLSRPPLLHLGNGTHVQQRRHTQSSVTAAASCVISSPRCPRCPRCPVHSFPSPPLSPRRPAPDPPAAPRQQTPRTPPVPSRPSGPLRLSRSGQHSCSRSSAINNVERF